MRFLILVSVFAVVLASCRREQTEAPTEAPTEVPTQAPAAAASDVAAAAQAAGKAVEDGADEADKVDKVDKVDKGKEWTAGVMDDKTAVVSLADVLAKAESFKDKAVRVEGTIEKVCQGMGCWLELRDGDSSVIVKSLDHSISFPKDSKGQRAIVDGLIRIKAAASCSGEHEEHGKEGHECPSPETLVEVTGAKLLASADK